MVRYQDLFNRTGLSLDRLRNFAVVAETGSLAKAAEGDATRASLFSKQIRELEGFFGVRLTERRGKGIALTTAGRELAQLTRFSLAGLEAFQQSCANRPQRVSIGTGNSIIEWLIAPRMNQLRRNVPGVHFEFQSLRTGAVVDRLTDLTLDVGVIRETSVPAHLKRKRVGRITYSLFVPAPMLQGRRRPELQDVLAAIPVATSMGGQFRNQLEQAAHKAGMPLRVEISSSSFTQAAQMMRAGSCGAILPDCASLNLEGGRFIQFPLPFLSAYERVLAVVWNPRLAEVRPVVDKLVKVLPAALGSAESQHTAPNNPTKPTQAGGARAESR
jgi:DNA-binding transcriptional LysR family regulator